MTSSRLSCLLPFITILLALSAPSRSQGISLPPRPPDAPGGREALLSLSYLDLNAREDSIYSFIMRGNVPEHLRGLVPVTSTVEADQRTITGTFFTIPDYLCIGSDSDFVYVPMTPDLAQRIASALGASLPTSRMVDLIYRQASVRLRPQPIPPGPAMITIPRFLEHNDSVAVLRKETGATLDPRALVAGHKKDVIISPLMYSGLRKNVDTPVVIYGWHKPDGTPIQPRYNGHTHTWADYSHGIRLVSDTVLVDERRMLLRDALADTALCKPFSDEGPIARPFYLSSPPSSGGSR